MRFEERPDKGLIKKDPKACERVESSLMIAERFLRSSNRNLEIDEYEMAEINQIPPKDLTCSQALCPSGNRSLFE